MYRKAVYVSDLQFGMYIAELDRPWTETPFMFQGFYLSTERQLQALRQLCRRVFVDVARSWPEGLAGEALQPAPTPGFQLRGTTAYPGQTALGGEIQVAAGLCAQTMKMLREAFAPLASGSTRLNAAPVQESVKGLAASVVRNPDALLLLSKMRDTSVAAHARALQVCIYMMVFARFLQLERDQIELLGLLGLLQDVGKLRLPDGPLEDEVVKKHVELSAHILGVTSGLPPKLASLALLHHERQDGSGYPRGLKGYQIGLNGSIAAICDRYDELLAPRPYGYGHAPSATVKALLDERGTAFHGPLLEEFIRCVGSFPVGTLVELGSGEIGVVIAENLTQRLKPKVMLLRDGARKVVDLAAKGGEAYRLRRALDQGALQFDPRSLFA